MPSPLESQRGPCIRVGSYVFDPLVEIPTLPAPLEIEPTQSGACWWLVQLHRPPTREEIARLKLRFSLLLTRRMPESAFLERFDAARVDALRREPVIRAVVAYQPAFKIAPALGGEALEKSGYARFGAGKLELMVVPFPGVNRAALAVKLRALGAEDPEDRGTRIRIRLQHCARIVDIARLDEVRAIEPLPRRARA